MSRDSSVLDSLRSVAVLLVLGDHTLETLGIAHRLIFQAGRLGVILFFVHTSFVLMLSMDRRGLVGLPLLRDFYVRRAFRLYPLSIATVGLVLALGMPVSPWMTLRPQLTATSLISNLALLTDITGALPVLTPMWSLSVEVLMYLALPFLFLIVRSRPTWTAGLWLLSIGLGIWGPLKVAELAPCFMGGVIAYAMSKITRPRVSFALWMLTLASLIAAYLAISALSSQTHWNPAAWAICVMLGIVLPCFDETHSRAIRVGSQEIARYSYGIYLGHMIALWLAFTVWPMPVTVLSLLWALAFLGVFCLIGYHVIESPGIRIGGKVAEYAAGRRRLACVTV